MIQSQTEYRRDQAADRDTLYGAAGFPVSDIVGDGVLSPGPEEVPGAGQDHRWALLEQAQAEHTVCTGTVAGLVDLSGYRPAVLADWRGIPVSIPARQMFCNKTWPEGKEMPSVLQGRLSRYLGATVDFVPVQVHPHERIAVGDRAAALLKKQRDYYDKQLVRPGRLAICRVLAVEPERVLAELFGVETWIPVDQLTWAWVEDARDVCRPGDVLACKVLGVVKTLKEGWTVKLSCIDAIEPPDETMLRRVRRGSAYLGTALEYQGNDVRVRLRAGMNVLCERDIGRDPVPGDTVSVLIREVDMNKMMARGSILEIRPNPQPDPVPRISQNRGERYGPWEDQGPGDRDIVDPKEKRGC